MEFLVSQRKGRMRFFLLFSTILLTGCAGSIFGGTSPEVQDMENIGTRRATKSEEAMLDQCLHFIFQRQKYSYMKHGTYIMKPLELNAKDACAEKIELKLEASKTAYTAEALIQEGKEQVKWSVNQNGEVVEHDDLNLDAIF